MVGGVTGKAWSRINRYISWKQNSLLLRIIFVYRIEAKQFFFIIFMLTKIQTDKCTQKNFSHLNKTSNLIDKSS